jgi:hypothetical protein
MTIGENPPLFHPQQTAYDYWNLYNAKFQQNYGLNIGTGNLTESPTVNSLLQFGNGLVSYGAVPMAYMQSGGDPAAVHRFNRMAWAHNPGNLTSTQLSPLIQALSGQSHLPIF